MTISPRPIQTTPEKRIWDRITDLEREIQRLRRQTTNAPQHAYAENIAGQSGINVGVGLAVVMASVTINVPTTDHRVLISPSVRLTNSNNTTEATAAWTSDDPTSGALVSPFGAVLNSITATTVSPGAPNWTAGQIEFWNQSFFIDAYNIPATAGSTHVPTPGDRTFNLVVYRNAGAGTITADQARLWVAVL